MIIWLFPEQLWSFAVPVLERLDGRSALEDGLGQLAVVEADIAQDGLLQILAAAEAVALQDVLDAAVEPLDHTIRLRSHRWGQAVFDAEIGAEAVEVVVAGGGATTQAEEPAGRTPCRCR